MGGNDSPIGPAVSWKALCMLYGSTPVLFYETHTHTHNGLDDLSRTLARTSSNVNHFPVKFMIALGQIT